MHTTTFVPLVYSSGEVAGAFFLGGPITMKDEYERVPRVLTLPGQHTVTLDKYTSARDAQERLCIRVTAKQEKHSEYTRWPSYVALENATHFSEWATQPSQPIRSNNHKGWLEAMFQGEGVSVQPTLPFDNTDGLGHLTYDAYANYEANALAYQELTGSEYVDLSVVTPAPVKVPSGPEVLFEFVQETAADIWEVPHHLGYEPAVTVLTAELVLVEPSEYTIVHTDDLTLQVQLDLPATGVVWCVYQTIA